MSYCPEDIGFIMNGIAGKYGEPLTIFNHKLVKNILLAAYRTPSTAKELAIELGVALPYMEDELEKLVSETLLRKNCKKYETNIVIVSAKAQEDIYLNLKEITSALTNAVIELLEYDMACKEAGMREEDIQALRREFDADYKRLSRENKRKDKLGFSSVSLSIITSDGDGFDCEIADPRANIEEDFIHNWELQRLGELMAELDPVDKEFLYNCFSGEKDLEKRICEKYGLQRNQMQYKRKKLLEQLRQGFEE